MIYNHCRVFILVEFNMPKFDSPIGSKQFQGQVTREFNVPDESGDTFDTPPHRRVRDQAAPVFDERAMQEFQAQMQEPQSRPAVREMSEVEREFLAAKKAKREGKERLSEGAKRRIEILIGMTRLTKDIEIDGQLYRLQTLKSKELRDALVATSEFDGSIQFVFETRKQLLARSLTVVAGVEIDQFLNSSDLQARLDFIEEMDHSLLVRLYGEYIKLSKEAEEKYALKTEEETKEVAEELKK